jgi:hypothetical protein
LVTVAVPVLVAVAVGGVPHHVVCPDTVCLCLCGSDADSLLWTIGYWLSSDECVLTTAK